MIRVTTSGDFKRTRTKLEKWLNLNGKILATLDKYGQMGVDLLSDATPRDTGETADSWAYEIGRQGGKYAIQWYNTHVENGAVVAILIQYGHGTGTGGYVSPVDYINPAMRGLFEQIRRDLVKEVLAT